jgi:hypothetical protein
LPTLLESALEYLGWGWSTIPVANKKAIGLWKPFQSVRPDEPTLRKLFGRKNVTGAAVILGAVSGMLGCRDFDSPEAYRRWKERNRSLAKTLPTVRTGRGFHVYFMVPREAFEVLGDGEYRADSAHYCVLPPSQHDSGRAYEWIRKPKGPLPEIDPVGDELILPMLGRASAEEKKQTQSILTQPKQPIACVPFSVADAISATLPTGPGQRNRRIFDLARQLKSIEDLDTSPPSLRSVFENWHQKALSVIRTKDFEESWSDFQIAWRRLRVPLKVTTVRMAFQAALAGPATFVDGSADLGALAALCKFLSTASQDGRFFLAVGTVATLFCISKTTAWRRLQSLEFDQIIQLVSKGSLKDRQASTWLYIGSGDFS